MTTRRERIEAAGSSGHLWDPTRSGSTAAAGAISQSGPGEDDQKIGFQLEMLFPYFAKPSVVSLFSFFSDPLKGQLI